MKLRYTSSDRIKDHRTKHVEVPLESEHSHHLFTSVFVYFLDRRLHIDQRISTKQAEVKYLLSRCYEYSLTSLIDETQWSLVRCLPLAEARYKCCGTQVTHNLQWCRISHSCSDDRDSNQSYDNTTTGTRCCGLYASARVVHQRTISRHAGIRNTRLAHLEVTEESVTHQSLQLEAPTVSSNMIAITEILAGGNAPLFQS